MINVVIGKFDFEGGVIASYFNESISIEDFNYENLNKVILQGLQSNVALLTDQSIVDSLAQTGLRGIYDLKCLQYILNEQNVALIVTDVNSADSALGYNIVVKVISPITSETSINKATDFYFNTESNKIDIPSIVKSMNDMYYLFDSNIFMENPINAIIESLSKMESAGIPTDSVDRELIDIMNQLGFQFVIYTVNE